jgi:hypothetical protein
MLSVAELLIGLLFILPECGLVIFLINTGVNYEFAHHLSGLQVVLLFGIVFGGWLFQLLYFLQKLVSWSVDRKYPR